jgi:DNA-directed RNA polymerase subunit RPC12/RpoP
MPWKHYDYPVYWSLPDDGADFKCSECGKRFHFTKVILTQIPKDDSRKTLCEECVDDDWKANAKFLGEAK